MNHEREELESWKRRYIRKSSIFQRVSKQAQTKVNQWIPEKAHKVVTESIKKMVQVTLKGSEWVSLHTIACMPGLLEREALMKERLEFYRKAATIEGAGTGAGGIFLGLADFPLLLSIKMKFLSECSLIHGYDPKQYEERLFLLYVFQLAFSSDSHKKEVLRIIENWEEEKEKLKELDWKTFQQEYRDYIDFVKMLQLIPGVGAVVGAYANYQLLDQLGEVAKFAYRIRFFNELE
ncbi:MULTISPECIES: EcsC family protein [Bacillaceae]|uniref:EcsC family protein n=1 Tax=Bacillaceae TaxID=186817 RepID=UPI001C594607|nr:EcsC family protein [Rossellomorea sp. YZS02]MBW3110597.1 EcsC family protein [Bacillus sp. MCCB 382]MDX8343426.1 EcsC family protein [Rossellomorea sp. YZS02]